MSGEPSAAKLIIENGADVNEIGKGGWCPIHVATYNSNICEMVSETEAIFNLKTVFFFIRL